MVNGPRESFGRPQWSDRAYPADHVPPSTTLEVGNRPNPEVPEFSPPMEIMKALNEHCKIPARQFFLAITDQHGHVKTYSSPNLKEDTPTFFHKQRWAQHASGQIVRGGPPAEGDLEFDGHQHRLPSRGFATRRRTRSIATDSGSQHPRKMRGSTSRRQNSDEDQSPKKALEISNTHAIWEFYDQRFKNIQQTACKQIAKAWVRLIAPKKQSIHPYTGKEEKQPDWWPKAWGNSKEDRVRHKEPDHLYRGERVHLLCHILRLIMQPVDKQHQDFQKLNLSVDKLKGAAYDSLSLWFKDKDHPNNKYKRPYLEEIFYVARHEERYLCGEIDATTNVYVKSDDKIPAKGADSDLEDAVHEEEDVERGAARSAISSASPSPPRTSSHALVSGLGHDTPGLPGPAPYISEVQPRAGPFQPQLMTSGLHADTHGHGHSYMGMTVGGPTTLHPHSASIASPQDMYAQSQPPSRRPSMFSSPTDYASGSPMYTSWPPGTTGPNATSPMYVGAPQQATTNHHHPAHGHPHPHVQAQAPGQNSFVSQPGVAMPQPSYMTVGPSFDDINRGNYEGHPEMFRVNSVPSHTVHSQGFPVPLSHDGRDLRDMPVPSGTIKHDRPPFPH